GIVQHRICIHRDTGGRAASCGTARGLCQCASDRSSVTRGWHQQTLLSVMQIVQGCSS
ncbi:unnamed protein product, partial [Phaeothamnion confervicola]